ncbi:hypothetical protein K474DRAFT_1297724 [Panus rudis PR-1116 ss-1]|nr:hypothetical protein K474DRAFT_1297724 [Panus rudis PR-1116 ss-1]
MDRAPHRQGLARNRTWVVGNFVRSESEVITATLQGHVDDNYSIIHIIPSAWFRLKSLETIELSVLGDHLVYDYSTPTGRIESTPLGMRELPGEQYIDLKNPRPRVRPLGQRKRAIWATAQRSALSAHCLSLTVTWTRVHSEVDKILNGMGSADRTELRF